MNFGALPPEINSARMYAGPGSGPMLAAAAGWDGLAIDLHSTATSYASVISGLTGASWLGPASVSTEAAAAPYVAWLSATAGRAEQTAAQAKAAAAAYQTAFAMTVPPPLIAANRSLLMSLIVTNILGQNTPAIAATEAHYAEMWAQDATAMYGYAGASAHAATLTPFTPPPPTTNPGGLAGQAAAVAQATGTAAATHAQSIMSAGPQLLSAVPSALQGLALSAADPPPLSTLSSLLSLISAPLTLISQPTMLGLLPTNLGISSAGLANAMRNTETLSALQPALTGGTGSGVGTLGLTDLRAVGGSAAVTAGLGRAGTVGALSVPQGWAAAAPVIRPVALSLPTIGATATPTVVSGTPGSLFSEMALASMAGRAIFGSGPGGNSGRTMIVVQHPPAAG